MGATQFLCFGEYLLYKSSNTYSINSCEIIEAFYNLRIDLDKLKYASYITKIVNDVTTENQNTYKVLQLFLNTLYMIADTKKDLDLINSIFRLRLMSIIGFRPQIDECSTCKTKDNLNCFSFKDSSLKCLECSKLDKGSMEISDTTKDALRYVVIANPKKIYSFEVPKDSIKELNIISKIYLEEILERKYEI